MVTMYEFSRNVMAKKNRWQCFPQYVHLSCIWLSTKRLQDL